MLTVKELFEKCKAEIEKGNGDRKIILCVNDDEFHTLRCSFSSPVYNASAVYEKIEDLGESEDSVIVLN